MRAGSLFSGVTGPTLHLGDCLDVLPTIDGGTVDAVVTDPPYALSFMGKGWDTHQSPRAFQEWCERWASECLRVLKPGGHLVSFGGTRTYHRMVCGVEDAGFEIRDQLAWMFGSGFPKSLDVSKAIDAQAGHHRGAAGARISDNGSMDSPNYERTAKGDPVTAAAAAWDGWGTALKPGWETILVATKPDLSREPDRIRASLCLLGNRIASLSPANPAVNRSVSSEAEHDAAVLASAQWSADERANTRAALCAQTDTSRFEWAISTSLNTVSSWLLTLDDLCEPTNTFTTETKSDTTTVLRTLKSCLSGVTPLTIILALTDPDGSKFNALPVARAFSAVAASMSATLTLSALASAIGDTRTSSLGEVEPELAPIVLARKPLVGTVAGNVLTFGVGSINIDGCRIGSKGGTTSDGPPNYKNAVYGHGMGGAPAVPLDAGRWPANVVLDEEWEPVLCLTYNLSDDAWDALTDWCNARNGRLPAVRGADRRAAEPGEASEVLLARMSGEVDEREPAREGSPDGGTTAPTGVDRKDAPIEERHAADRAGQSGVEGALSLEGLRDDLAARRQGDPGAPAGDGGDFGTEAPTGRGRASRQRGEGRQSAREPRTAREQDAQVDARGALPGASGASRARVEVLLRDVPAGWLRFFEFTGDVVRCGAGAMLDEQSGELVSGANPTSVAPARGVDVGGASRFFYCPKVTAAERHAGLAVPTLLTQDAPERNAHPTVKPIDLMRWLCRLVTPPGGTILDPFLGSGTTGIAAVLEGFGFVGIEREPDYLAIADARIAHWTVGVLA